MPQAELVITSSIFYNGRPQICSLRLDYTEHLYIYLGG